MLAFLDVVPGELLLQPRRLQAGQIDVCIFNVMADGEPVCTVAARNRGDLDRPDRGFTLAANPSRSAAGAAPLAYQRGSLRWRACPR